MQEYKSPLHETVNTTATDLWDDSCSIEELHYSMEHGSPFAESKKGLQQTTEALLPNKRKVYNKLQKPFYWIKEKATTNYESSFIE